MKVTLGLLLLSAAGYLLWQQFVGKVPSAVAADHLPLKDVSAVSEEIAVSAGATEQPQPLPTEQKLASSPVAIKQEVEQAVVVENMVAKPTAAATNQQTPAQDSLQNTGRSLPKGFSRIVLAATMEQLEPGAAIDTLVAQQQIQRLYLFTELQGYAGQQLIHRWSFAGQVQTEALLTIEDSPWRTYSEKWLLPDQLGSWRVEIVDQQQNVLYQHDFQYQ